jgi:transaldolase/glucose-6-phosphate isomerase
MNPLLKLTSFGQSIWLDYIRRHLILSGGLDRLIADDGLRGVTSNPTIFEKAISGSHDYDDAIRALALKEMSAEQIYESVTVEDIRQACDRFLPLYRSLDGRDGFVSLEVSPQFANDTSGTISEARRLWTAVDRPNVMIKVPATLAGIPAIRQLTSEGMNINITLLFGLPRYRRVIEAYLSGLEDRVNRNLPVHGIASVASFFLSRIDTILDPVLEKIERSGNSRGRLASQCRGRTAIACAKIAYEIYKGVFQEGRFRELKRAGARTQRLLWASTSTKNPQYKDTMYVEALIGPDTVNTLPMETIDAYRDHGDPASRLEENLDEARAVLSNLIELGISIDEVTYKLEKDGIEKFNEPFRKLITAIESRRKKIFDEQIDSQTVAAGKEQVNYEHLMHTIEEEHLSERLWRKDPALWKTEPESWKDIRNSLGWIHVADKMMENVDDLLAFAAETRKDGFLSVVHMGMGGSSLAPITLQKIFPVTNETIPLTVLDTTDPATIRHIEKSISIEKTLFIVASKSGTTAEPLAFYDYFYDKVRQIKGNRAGENFVAITDPDTPLAEIARDKNFRKTFLNYADIGGRYSALSYFGLVPAALLGIDLNEFLARALRMEHACSPSVPFHENPGIALGALIGALAREGRDKLTFIMPDQIAALGMWLEQLLAESTGKNGKGVLPVTGEPNEPAHIYGEDRIFVYITLGGYTDGIYERKVSALERLGYPVVKIRMDDVYDTAQEFYRWEIATATMGAVLGINAFDQPNVQESKDYTNQYLSMAARGEPLPEGNPAIIENRLSVFTQETDSDLRGTLRHFLQSSGKGSYVSLQAYLPETPENDRILQDIRARILEQSHITTTLGYGPRFLHSTGQYHKGGPNTGLFIQLTADTREDAPIPGRPYTFETFIRAQALGDFEALRKHGRRIMRIHLGSDPVSGLHVLEHYIMDAIV